MHKIAIIFVVIFACALVLSGCAPQTNNGIAVKNTQKTSVANDVGGNLCEEFDADFTYSVLNKPIAYMNASPLNDLTYCQYYTEYKDDYYKLPGGKVMPGGPWISMNAENLSVENQKKANEFLGHKIETNDKIKMENFMVILEDGTINSIYLVINPNRFVSLDLGTKTVITNDEMVNWAVKVAEKIQGKLSVEIKKNPLGNEVKPWGKSVNYKPEAVGESQKQVAENFINLLRDKKFDEAINMMDANAETKAGWKTNFAAIKSLEVKKLEPVYPEEWTAEHQAFKADLEVSVTAEGEHYGWNNGQNTRWISLQRNNGIWQIHELANNP